jgi:opacity protein-like surface antigen
MKYQVILFLIVITSSLSFAQRKADIGITGGTSYYQGDINPNKLFYKPRYNIGPMFRYNFNKRYSLKIKAVYANIAGSVQDFNFVVPPVNATTTFSANFVNVSAQVEYNFFNYITGLEAGKTTPYIFGGLGYSYVFSPGLANSNIAPSNKHVSLPFGIGAKINATKRLSFALEWSYNKTFTDKIDGFVSPLGETKLFNNDWYSFFNLCITYKFFKFAADCPAYDKKKFK